MHLTFDHPNQAAAATANKVHIAWEGSDGRWNVYIWDIDPTEENMIEVMLEHGLIKAVETAC